MTKTHERGPAIDIETVPNLDEHPGAAVLRAGVAHVLKDPAAFIMGDWLRRRSDSWCGAVGCLAGHIVLAVEGHDARTNDEAIFPTACNRAARYAKLTGEDINRLFYTNGWPASMYERFHGAHTDAERAAALQERVEYFIRTRK